jgi:predicted nucleotidyltransferase component of viral defense system
MNEAVQHMLSHYRCHSAEDYENALKEIIQEIALLGLWRSKFFDNAAFYGGTALRILYGLNRFSEDLDFSLLKPNKTFQLDKYNKSVQSELQSFGFIVTVETKQKTLPSNIQSAFIKAGTKKQMLEVQVPEQVIRRIHRDKCLKIKIEIDINPPGDFVTEVKNLLNPIPFSVNTFQQPDLFAGKMHAILCRNWGNRVKGRDWYDLVWYIGQKIPVRIKHLQARLIQTKKRKIKLDRDKLVILLNDKIDTIDLKSVKQEVKPFLQDPDSIKVWSKDFFRKIITEIQIV